MNQISQKKANALAETKAALCRAYANKANETLHGKWMDKTADEWNQEAARLLAKKG